jgi:hypothetical protein
LSGATGTGQKGLSCASAKKRPEDAKTRDAREAKALGGDGVEFPAALVAVTATLRITMAKLSEDCITALEYACWQLRASTRFCKVLSGPTPEDSLGFGGAFGVSGEGSFRFFLPDQEV